METQNLRILFVVDAIKGRNGVGTYYQDLVGLLSERIERAELVAPSLDDPHFCQGGSLPMPGDTTQRLFFPHMRALTRLMEEMQPHVVVVPGPGLFSLGGYWLARKMGVPVCVTFQTDYTHLVQLYWGPLLARLVCGLLDRLNLAMFHGASSVVTISETMMEQARAIGVARPHLVGTPVASEFIRCPAEPPRDGVRSVLFVGRLAAEKHIGAFLELAARRPDLTFTVLGDGPLRGEVQASAERLDNLFFAGWRSRDEVMTFLDNHDVLMLPSSVEAFGTVALEAMARARWVITSHACGINQWPGLARGLLPLGEGETLDQGLRRLEQLEPAWRTGLARRGRQLAVAVNDETLASWEDVLGQTALRAPERPAPSATLGLLRRLGARAS
ncbi:glycosyltransferase [Marinobacter zhanjiangensis]|uniref:Uncharacterized protein n=1 Tax=Marinobacter zhanjiangensis TaxID=578215 RepID=A0ABQ3B4N6_9GAMM|nr:glycosyltransferase [Marinobacter zhanjiangensis]GGY73403.1 hypothetical protein GCM10007071_20710 [Marinobacter zhanjiangensis]